MDQAKYHGQGMASKWTATIHVVLMTLACAVLLPAMSPGQAVGGSLVVRLLFLGRMAALVMFATLLLRQRGLHWKDVGLHGPIRWRTALAAICGFVACFVAAAIVSLLIKRFGLSAPNYKMFAPLKGNLFEYLFWLIPVTGGSAAFGEELLFRGFFINSLAVIAGGKRAPHLILVIVAQSLIFGALHLYQGPGGAIMAGTIGLVLGFVWLFSGRNLWAGIIVHALLDGSAMTFIYINGPP